MIDLAFPWSVRPLPLDDWGMVRDANYSPIVRTGSFSDTREFNELGHKFGSPAYLRGPRRTAAIAEWVVMAAAAYEIMMRRGWHPYPIHRDGRLWWIVMSGLIEVPPAKCWDDPFTAIVETDKWCRENVEIKVKQPEKEQAT